MRLRSRIIVYLLSGLLLLSGCAGNGKADKDKIPKPTKQTIILNEIGIQAENTSPYTGIYIEQGDDENKDRVEGVYALAITNTAQKTIQNAHLVFSDGNDELHFYLQMLPCGSTVTVVEYDKKPVKSGDLQLVDSQINYLSDAIEDPDGFEVLESEYGSFIVENKTKQELDKVEIYYRRAFEDGTLGGICYVEVLEDVGIGDIVYADPGYWSDKCAIVNILLYPDVEDSTNDSDDTVVDIFPETN